MNEVALLKRAVKTSTQGLSFTLKETARSRKPVLILSPGSSVAEDFLRYQPAACFDCKQACLDVVVWKKKSIADVRVEIRAALRCALSGKKEHEQKEGYTNLAGTLMRRNLYTSPLWLSFGTSAFHLSGLLSEAQGLPLSALTGSYSHEEGVEHGVLSRQEANVVDRDAFPFRVILTSQLSVADAARFLTPAVPGFDDLIIIYVEPTEGEDGHTTTATVAAQRRDCRVHRPLPEEARARVEAAILSRNEVEMQTAIAAAKEHWVENGRYLSREELPVSGQQVEKDVGKRSKTDSKQHAGATHGAQTPLAGTSERLTKLQADFAATDDTAAVEAEAWTVLEVSDWVEINNVWLELASSADEEEWQQV